MHAGCLKRDLLIRAVLSTHSSCSQNDANIHIH